MEHLDNSRIEGATEIHTSMRQIIRQCHANQTLYVIMQTDKFYDVDQLRHWREKFGFNDIIDKLSDKINGANLQDVQFLTPEAEEHLRKLANSKISDLNFSRYTELIERQITKIDLTSFIKQLEGVSRKLNRATAARVLIQNEVLILNSLAQVVNQMRDAMFELKSSVDALETEVTFNKANFRKVITQVINQARKGPEEFLDRKGPQLVGSLANKYIEEAVDLIDVYVDRVISRTKKSIGQCHPVSLSFNATVDAVCKEIVDPFNGFWASVGWCVVLYLPSIAIALALVSLYRKSEPYPGPLVGPEEAAPSNGSRGSGARAAAAANNKKGKKRPGHRRNPSEYLPDSAHHYRGANAGSGGYSYQANHDANSRFQDAAPRNYSSGGGGGRSAAVSQAVTQQQAAPLRRSGSVSGDEQPPRYISNPNLANMEYERPPPYYYPGASAPGTSGSGAPPPLPPPNRT